MGKEKKPVKLGIKTSRYFTKTCGKCGFEYPNWFTNCPRCHAEYMESAAKIEEIKAPKNKTIKIVVKITEEDFNEAIQKVQLIFSANQGVSWYQMRMDPKMDYYIAEILEVPIGSVIVYYVEVHLANGEKVIENNGGKYFYYEVGGAIATETKEEPTQAETQSIQENIAQFSPSPQEYNNPEENSKQPTTTEETTIFGKLQTKIEPDLKVCPKCSSKIKKMWSICPICGNKF